MALWITETFPLFARTPEAGTRRDEIEPGVRGFPVGKYMIYYRTIGPHVVIARVIHGMRDHVRRLTPLTPAWSRVESGYSAPGAPARRVGLMASKEDRRPWGLLWVLTSGQHFLAGAVVPGDFKVMILIGKTSAGSLQRSKVTKFLVQLISRTSGAGLSSPA
jgi:hypothetical protein